MFKKIRKSKTGSILIFAYAAIISLFVFVGVLTHRAISSLVHAQVNMARTEALYLSEGGLSNVVYNLGYAIANYMSEPVTGTPLPLSGLAFPPSAGFVPVEFNLLYTCEPVGGEQMLVDSYGIVTFVRNYKINLLASHNGYHADGKPLTVSLNQIIARKKTYTFQHAVFYEDDLEMLPGPPMTLSGKVHTNSDLYVGSDGNTLTINSDYLYSAGDIFYKRKDNGVILSGQVKIKIKDSSSYDYMFTAGDPAPLDSLRADWASESQNRWNGTVKSSVHGVSRLAVPAVASIQPDGFYASNANVKVENGAIRKGGALLVEGVDMPVGTVKTRTTFYNNREGKWVKMTEIDMRKLAGYDEADPVGSPSFPSQLPDNGLLYATRNDVSGGQAPGIKLVHGEEIHRAHGLTVVSNQPVYVKGDYNNENKKPAAVICDSVNLLSNLWDDGTSTSGLPSRVPDNTQVNMAFIAGIDTTTTGQYNGGLENYPRLHENWSQSPRRTLTIRGSFVELWNSIFSQGEWLYGNPQYTAPTRDWDYDTDFNDVDNLPPFTPFAVEMQRVAWWVS